MSFRHGILLFSTVAILVLGITRWFESVLLVLGTMPTVSPEVIGDASRSITYRLESREWAVFDVPADHGALKLITNAACEPESARAGVDEAVYAVEYFFRGSDGDAAKGAEGSDPIKVHWFRSRISREVRDQDGDAASRLFFLGRREEPTDGRVILLDLEGVPEGAKELHLRAVETGDGVRAVLARIYYQRWLSAAQQMYRWQRMGKAKRERVARLDAFPPDLLGPDERQLYSTFEWSALAPRGVVGRDYTVCILYRRRSVDQEDLVPVEPVGRIVRPTRRLTIPLPEGESPVRLDLRRAGPVSPEDEPVTVAMRWLDPRGYSTALARVEVGAELESWRGTLRGGTLDLATDGDVVVRAFLDEAGVDVEITPRGLLARGFVCGSWPAGEGGGPLVYDVSHAGGERTPMRIDVRRISSSWRLADGDSEVVAEFVDAAGDVLWTSSLPAGREASFYDDVVGGGEEPYASRAERYHFLVPPGVEQARLLGGGGSVVASVGVRVPGTARAVRVPEDEYTFHRLESPAPQWHPLLPRNVDALRAEGRERRIRVDTEPERVDPDVLESNYTVTRLSPRRTWVGRVLIAPVERFDVDARDAYSVSCTSIPAGEDVVVDFAGRVGETLIQPRVVVLGAQRVSGPVELAIEGVTQRLWVEPGENLDHVLSPLTAGRHLVRVSAPPRARVLLSHVIAPRPDDYLRRLAIEIDRREYRFPYSMARSGSRVLVARLALDPTVGDRVSVCVSVRPPLPRETGPHRGWTYLERTYDVRPGEPGGTYALGGDVPALRGARRLVVPLEEDLPPGEYEIVFRFGPGVSGCFGVSVVELGSFERLRLHARRAPSGFGPG